MPLPSSHAVPTPAGPPPGFPSEGHLRRCDRTGQCSEGNPPGHLTKKFRQNAEIFVRRQDPWLFWNRRVPGSGRAPRQGPFRGRFSAASLAGRSDGGGPAGPQARYCNGQECAPSNHSAAGPSACRARTWYGTPPLGVRGDHRLSQATITAYRQGHSSLIARDDHRLSLGTIIAYR